LHAELPGSGPTSHSLFLQWPAERAQREHPQSPRGLLALPIPRPLGVNPSRTIGALSERIAAIIIAEES